MADINLGRKTSRDGRGLDGKPFNLPHTRCDSLALDVLRETLGLNRVILMHFLVAGEGLHHLDVPAQRRGVFYSKALVPGDKNGKTITLHQSVRAV